LIRLNIFGDPALSRRVHTRRKSMSYDDPPSLRGSSEYARSSRTRRRKATVWGVLGVLAILVVTWFMFYDTGRGSPKTTTVSSTPDTINDGPRTRSNEYGKTSTLAPAPR